LLRVKVDMPYKYLEELAIADVAFEATGKDLNELFADCAKAVENAQVPDLNKIEKKEKRTIELERDSLENALHDFLEELIYLKDAELLLFGEFKVRVSKKDGKFSVRAEAWGERHDPKKHESLVDVKAVTWHQFEVKKNKVWKARMILDV